MKILNTAPLHNEFIKLFENDFDYIQATPEEESLLGEDQFVELMEKENPEILIVELNNVTEKVIRAADSLKLIAVCRGGTTNINLDAAKKAGVVVINTPARNAVAVAEFTISLMINISRHIIQSIEFVKNHKWIDLLETFYRFEGNELYGKTAGIIGLGDTGQEVAKRLMAFDMTLIGYDPGFTEERIKDLDVNLVDLESLVKVSDYILLHASVTDSSRNMINKKILDLMKPNAYFINMARAALVVEDDLIDALVNKRIAGAALDVHSIEPLPLDSPWMDMENVIITPHLGGSAKEIILRHSKMVYEDIISFTKRDELKNRVV